MGAICNQGIIYGGSTPINDVSVANKTTYSSNKIESRLAENQSIIGESYDPTKSYAVGERFIDGNVIYTVKVACTGVTPPNTTYYTGRRVVDEINALESGVNALKNTTTSTITKGTSGSATIGGTLYSNTIIKSGRVVIASALLDGIGGIPDRVNCYPFIIPNGYRPFTATHVPVIFLLSGNSNFFVSLCPVSPDGKVQFSYQVSEGDKSLVNRLVLLNGTWISEP